MASKIIYMAVAMVFLNLGLIIFSCPLMGPCSSSLVASNLTSGSNSSIIDMIFDPTTVGGGFWETLFGGGWGLLAALGVVVGATVLVGTTVFGKDLGSLVYLAIGIGLASMVYPTIRLWQLIYGLGMVGDTMTRSILAIVVASTFFIAGVFTILDWARGRE